VEHALVDIAGLELRAERTERRATGVGSGVRILPVRARKRSGAIEVTSRGIARAGSGPGREAHRDFDLVPHEHLRDEREALAAGGETRGRHGVEAASDADRGCVT
jgi:hypothetical protein